GGDDTESDASRARDGFRFSTQIRELPVGEPHPLHSPENIRLYRRQRRVRLFGGEDLFHLREEPRIDAGDLIDLARLYSRFERAFHLEDSLRCRAPQRTAKRLGRIVLESIVDE